MSQAGRGPEYISKIITQEVQPFWPRRANRENRPLVKLDTRARFNPNMQQGWFVADQPDHQQHLRAGDLPDGRGRAARARARNDRASAGDAAAALRADVRQDLGEWTGRRRGGDGVAVPGREGRASACPSQGSIPLFVSGLVVYLFSVTALGIMLATLVRSMPQFGLLAFPVFIVMSLLSGGQTPLESMPVALQKIMQFVPSTHFVSFSQAVLFRNAT